MKSESEMLRIEFWALDLKEEKLKIDLDEIRSRKKTIADKIFSGNINPTLQEIIKI